MAQASSLCVPKRMKLENGHGSLQSMRRQWINRTKKRSTNQRLESNVKPFRSGSKKQSKHFRVESRNKFDSSFLILHSAFSRNQTMSADKTLDKILRGDSDTNLRFDELCHLLQAKGFRMRVSGSHHIFTMTGVMERVNLQREGSKAKPYQVRQIRKILATYKLI